jgi:hypothetical protein
MKEGFTSGYFNKVQDLERAQALVPQKIQI